MAEDRRVKRHPTLDELKSDPAWRTHGVATALDVCWICHRVYVIEPHNVEICSNTGHMIIISRPHPDDTAKETTMKTWVADCAFIDTVDSGREKGYTIHFTAEDADEAFDAAMRWARGRHADWPEMFGVVGCIKLYIFQPSPIDEAGQYTLPTSFPVREWKYDTV